MIHWSYSHILGRHPYLAINKNTFIGSFRACQILAKMCPLKQEVWAGAEGLHSSQTPGDPAAAGPHAAVSMLQRCFGGLQTVGPHPHVQSLRANISVFKLECYNSPVSNFNPMHWQYASLGLQINPENTDASPLMPFLRVHRHRHARK